MARHTGSVGPGGKSRAGNKAYRAWFSKNADILKPFGVEIEHGEESYGFGGWNVFGEPVCKYKGVCLRCICAYAHDRKLFTIHRPAAKSDIGTSGALVYIVDTLDGTDANGFVDIAFGLQEDICK